MNGEFFQAHYTGTYDGLTSRIHPTQPSRFSSVSGRKKLRTNPYTICIIHIYVGADKTEKWGFLILPLCAAWRPYAGIAVSVIHAVVVSLLRYTLCNLCQTVPKVFSTYSQLWGLLWGSIQYVNAEAGTRQRSICIHSRSNHPCVYTSFVYWNPLGCRSISSSASRQFLITIHWVIGVCINRQRHRLKATAASETRRWMLIADNSCIRCKAKCRPISQQQW